jgi:hypothetical protein
VCLLTAPIAALELFGGQPEAVLSGLISGAIGVGFGCMGISSIREARSGGCLPAEFSILPRIPVLKAIWDVAQKRRFEKKPSRLPI